jgi:hypothetical protein
MISNIYGHTNHTKYGAPYSNLGIINESTMYILICSSKQPMYTTLIIIVLEKGCQAFSDKNLDFWWKLLYM